MSHVIVATINAANDNARVNVWDDMQLRLAELDAQGLRRHPVTLESAAGPRVRVAGRDLLCLCSNDYLGLANDPAVRTAAIAAVETCGVGSGASRLVCGTTALHAELERRLAEFKRLPAAVVTPTGWMANHAAIHALAGRGDLIFCDKLNHASILDAAMSCGARMRTYPHCDVARLEALLARHRADGKRCLIVTDSLFSMDGDFASLPQLAELKRRYDAILLIDDAHATGVFGRDGRGAAELLNVEDGVDVVVGTLSKALGSLGGFVAGPEVLAEYIRNTARPYIYTTAAPAMLAAAALAGLDVVRDQPQRRAKLLDLAARLRDRLGAAGFQTGDSASQIIPVVLGEADRAMRVSVALREAGFLVPAIRPPTVPRGASRLRVSISSVHEWSDLESFLAALVHAAGN